MVERRYIKNFDSTLALTALAIIAFGCVAIYSASSGGRGGNAYVERQILSACVGLVAAAILASIDHSTYHRYAGKVYGWTLVVLVLVLKLGHQSKGAQRWIAIGPFQFQPSEFAKVALIIALAVFFVKRQDEIRSLKTFALSFAYLAVPMALIFRQPDLGTSLVLVAIWITMAFVAGTDVKNILLFVAGVLAVGLVAWNVPGLIKDYQKARVISFINPCADPLGSGYHVTQSRIAIGSGQILGKGYLKGTQRKLRFIPEQHTDFIFTVVGEEMGFAGAAGLVGLYFILLWRALNIMSASEDATGRIIAAGIVGMFLFYVFVNIGMTLGIMPVTGVPLPLFSYGGSSMVSNLMAIGLLEGISMRRHRISF
ncbi:MAG: rod shape-determining protein RodA [Armatimonadota bacterium]